MDRRIDSRRFIGPRRCPRGPISSGACVQDELPWNVGAHAILKAHARPGPKRYRLSILAGSLLALGTLITALALPSDSKAHRFPADRFTTPPLDHLIWWDSFSEIDQTKGILRGLGLQAIAEIRRSYLKSRHDPEAELASGPTFATSHSALDSAISQVRRRLSEFEGTEQATLFKSELLRLLRRAGRHDEWLDAYLEIVYRHPGDALILVEALRAADAAKSTHRETEWRDAMEHWNQIPQRHRAEASGTVEATFPIPEPILP